MKNKMIFVGINVFLVAAVGLIIGLVFSDNVFQGTTGITAFVFLLVTLAIPSLIYVLNSKLNTGSRIIASFFIITEIILNIVYLCIPKADIKVYAIIQLVMIALTLTSFLIILGLFKENNSKENS